MGMHIWNQKPEWWDSFISILRERVDRRGRVILTRGVLLKYLLKVNAIDMRDRGYRNVIVMARQALLDGSWNDGLKVTRISKTTLKVVRDADNRS